MAIDLSKEKNELKYYYSENGATLGPFSLSQLLEKIDGETLVYREGMEWTNAKNVDELKKFFKEKTIYANNSAISDSSSSNLTQANPYAQQPYQNVTGPARDLNNATAILVLGILSIIGAFCYGFLGIGFGIAAVVMGNKARREYESNPGMYTDSSRNNANSGRICGIIGLIIGGLMFLIIILAALASAL
jgi:hypothetical protein